MSKEIIHSGASKLSPDLKSMDKAAFESDYNSVLIEQWKTCVETANGITEKRNAANSIFITVNVALFAIITFALEYKNILLSAVGIITCILWIHLLDSYKRLNEVKYDIINEIEVLLPLSPFTAEWNRLCRYGKYSGLTKIEKVVPAVFLALYGAALAWPLLRWLSQIVCPCIAK